MEIQVSKLRDALDLLEPAVPKKASLDTLKHVLMGEGRAVATDLDTRVVLDLPEAVETFLLPPKTTLEFLNYIPGYKLAKLTAKGREVVIAVEGTEASFKVPAAEEFPPIPKPEFLHEGVLDGDALVKALWAVLTYAAGEDARPVLNGVCLTTGEEVEAAGADGFRLAWERIPGKLAGEKPFLIPWHAVTLLERLWKKAAVPDVSNIANPAQLAMAKRLARLEWNADTLQLRFGRVTMLVKLIQGTYPTYRGLIPTALAESVTFQAEEMLRALEQVKGAAKGSRGIVRLCWEGESLQVSARAEDVGERSVVLPARCSGPGRIAFDIRLLFDFFNGRESEVTIALSGGDQGPALFSHKGVSKAVLMPMFVKDWKDEIPPPTSEGEPEGEGENGEGPVDESPGPVDETPEPVAAAEVKSKRRRKASKS